MTPHILLVEGNRMHREMAREILIELGYQVTAMGNAYAAFANIATDPFEYVLILMDWEMPDMIGLEVVKKLRAHEVEKEWPHIPVIAFTRSKKEGSQRASLETVVDDYLSKEIFYPKWREILLEKLSKWLNVEDQ